MQAGTSEREAFEAIAASAVSRPDIASAAIFVTDDGSSSLRLAGAAGIEGVALDRLTAAVLDPEHPIARTMATGVAGFDVLPIAPGGPALRSHVPLVDSRGDRPVVLGVLAVAHEQPLELGVRAALLDLADRGADALDRSKPQARGAS